MKRLVIEISEAGDPRPGFDVVDEAGRRCDGLSWDEMLGQVVMLTVPRGRIGTGFAMHTPEEWARQRDERRARREGATS